MAVFQDLKDVKVEFTGAPKLKRTQGDLAAHDGKASFFGQLPVNVEIGEEEVAELRWN
jgi:hypothetical protein